jgi:hypothetical protein
MGQIRSGVIAKEKSRLVNCEICNKELRVRGLAGHMRIKHHIVAKVVTKVISVLPDLTPANEEEKLTNSINQLKTLDRITRVIEQTVSYKKVDVVPGRFSRVIHFKDCAHCKKQIEVNPEQSHLLQQENRFACEDCIENYYPYHEHPNWAVFKQTDKNDIARVGTNYRPRLPFSIYPIGSLYFEYCTEPGCYSQEGTWKTVNIYDSKGKLIWNRISLKKGKK